MHAVVFKILSVNFFLDAAFVQSTETDEGDTERYKLKSVWITFILGRLNRGADW